MKQEDKELLLKDLGARLRYRVKVTTTNPSVELGVISGISIENKISVRTKHADIVFDCTEVKPYLRPMSSMTEEEDKERIQLGIWRSSQINNYEVTRISPDISESYNSQAFQNALDFLFKKHFDIFGLIPKGLAIAVTKENNPYN